MDDAARLAQDFPDVTFILLHAGMLEDRSGRLVAVASRHGAARRTPEHLVKLSGLGAFAPACSVELWRPVVEPTVDLFGPARCLFGSNFPIEKLWTSYAELIAAMRACHSRYAPGERREILHDTLINRSF